MLMKRNEAPTDAVLLQQAKVAAAKRRKEEAWNNAAVPPAYLGFTFKGYIDATRGDEGKQPLVTAILNHFKGVNVKPGIMACGPTNLGKTGALCPLFTYYIEEKNYGGLWLPYKALMAAARDF